MHAIRSNKKTHFCYSKSGKTQFCHSKLRFFYFFFRKKKFGGRADACEAAQRKNAVLLLKKWKNAVLSDKTAFFLFFFQKKNFGRADACDASQRLCRFIKQALHHH